MSFSKKEQKRGSNELKLDRKNEKIDPINSIVNVLQRNFSEALIHQTNDKARKIAENLRNKTKLQASELITKLRKDNGCSLIKPQCTNTDLEKTIKHAVWFSTYSGNSCNNYDLISLCKKNNQQQICINLNHHSIKNKININPRPILPSDPDASEQPFLEGKNTDDEIKTENETIVVDSMLDGSYNVALKEAFNEKEDDVQGDKIDEEELFKCIMAETVREVHKSAARCEKQDAVISPNRTKCPRVMAENTLAVFKKNETELKKTLQSLIYGGNLRLSFKPTAYFDENLKKAEKFIIDKKGTTAHYDESIRRLKIFIASMYELKNMSKLVNIYRAEMELSSLATDKIEKRLEELFLDMVELSNKIITKEGYEKKWPLKILTETIEHGASSSKDYFCYIIAKENDDNKLKLENKDFHVAKFNEYQKHLINIYERRSDFMESYAAFNRGRTATKNKTLDLDEFKLLKASTVASSRINVAISLRFLGILEMKCGNFKALPEEIIAFTNQLKKKRVSENRDIRPILLHDILAFFNKTVVKSIVDLQDRVLIMFLNISGWKLKSIITGIGKKAVDSHSKIKLKHIKFSNENGIRTIEVFDPQCEEIEKDRNSIVVPCSKKTHCFVCYLFLLLQKRNSFEISSSENNNCSLQIKKLKLETYLFVQPENTIGRLQEEKCLEYDHLIKVFMPYFASTMNIPHSLVTPNTFSMGAVNEKLFIIMEKEKGAKTINEMKIILKSQAKLPSEIPFSHLNFDENELYNTLESYKKALKDDLEANPRNFHKYIKDIFNDDKFAIKTNDIIVTLILKFLKPYWLKNRQISTEKMKRFNHHRRLMIACQLNLFLHYFQSNEIVMQNVSDLNPTNELDLETILKFYTWSMTDKIDKKIGKKCPFNECNVEDTSLKIHFNNIHPKKPIPCTACDKKFKDCITWQTHLNNFHRFYWNCRCCHSLMPKVCSDICKKATHNVVYASTLSLHWKNKLENEIMLPKLEKLTIIKKEDA